MQAKILNGRYELERKIGEGGMARVYIGRDVRLGRAVAVKVLHSHYVGDPGFLSRFQHEAEAAARISHPNVVDIFDVGNDGDIHYIVMAYVPGQDLKKILLREAPLDIERAIRIAEQVALGLDAAHRMGLIHRDVKPQNVLIGDDDHAHLTDFGIAKSHLSTALTDTGVAFGTADYISPEQARGQPASPQSDIYALGVTLYEMLTGRLPFNGDSPVTVAMKHVTDTPQPPHRLNPQIPPALDALVMRALAKEPAERPASAAEFARLLRGLRELASASTVIGPAARPAARPVVTPPISQPRPAPPPPPTVSAAPRQGGVSCGVFVLGMLLLSGLLGLVALFATTDLFDRLLSSGPGVPGRPTAVPTASSPTPSPTTLPLVVVPAVQGLTEAEAIQALVSLSLTPAIGEERNDPLVDVGRIIAQEPPAQSSIAAGSVVTLTVSLGPELVAVPDVARIQRQLAESQLRRAGFQVAVREERSANVSAGFVIRTEPFAQERVPRGDTVTIVVSVGNLVRVPNVEGLNLDDARRVISASGLFISFEDFQTRDRFPDPEVYDRTPPNVVVSSDPAGGTLVDPNTGITLGIRAP